MLTATRSSLPPELLDRLLALRSRVRTLTLLRGIGWTAVVAAAAVVVSIGADWLFEMPTGGRIALLLGSLAIVAVSVRKNLWHPLHRPVPLAELAALVERQNPDLGERLSSLVELSDADEPEAWKGSQLMREFLANEAQQAASRIEFGSAAPGGSAYGWSAIGAVCCLLLVLPGLFAPHAYARRLARLLLPWGEHEPLANLHFEVDPGDRVVARGSDVLIRGTPRTKEVSDAPASDVRLHSTSGEQADSRRMDFDAGSGTYVATLPHVFQSFDYDLRSPLGRSRRYHIRVEDAPTLTGLALEVEPPAYTGRPAKTIDGAVGRIDVFERSRLRFRLTFNKPVARAELVWLDPEAKVDGGQLTVDEEKADVHESEIENRKSEIGNRPASLPVTLAADRTSGTLEFVAETGGPFAIRLTDEFDLTNPVDPHRELVLTPDAPPKLVLSGSDEPQDVRPGDLASIHVIADDDIGVAALELHFDIAHPGVPPGENDPQATAFPAPVSALGGQRVTHEFELELASLGLVEGDEMTYRVRAADERPVPGPQEVWSKPRTLRIKKDAPPAGARELAAEQSELREAIDTLRKDLTVDKEQAAAAQAQVDAAARNDKEFPAAENEKLADLAQQQGELAERLEQLAAQLDDHPLFQKLAESAHQIAQQELAQAEHRIEAAKQESNLAKKRDELGKATEQLAAAEKKLDGLEDRFDKVAETEQNLLELNRLADQARQLAAKADELRQRQDELADAVGQASSPDSKPGGAPEEPQLTDQQLADLKAVQQLAEGMEARQLAEDTAALQAEQRELTEKLADLMRDNPELRDATRREQLDRIGELAKQAEALAKPQEKLAEAVAAREAQPEEFRPTKDSLPSSQETAAAQQKLARDANQLAKDIARETGAESAASREANEFARDAATASQQAEAGKFTQASEAAQEASANAGQTAAEVEATAPKEGTPGAEARDRASELAERQRQVAGDLAKIADTPAEQQRRQQELTAQTEQLTERLVNATQALGNDPQEKSESTERAQAAQQAVEQAREASQQAAEQLQKGDASAAAESAKQAGENLREAAQQAREAAGQPTAQPGEKQSAPGESEQPGQKKSEGQPQQPGEQKPGEQKPSDPPQQAGQPGDSLQGDNANIPAAAANQLATAREQLARAEQQLAQAAEMAEKSQAGEPGSEGQPGDGGQPSSQSAPGKGQQPGQPGQASQGENSGQSPSKSASGSEGKPGEGSQPGSEGKPSEGGQPSSQPAPGKGQQPGQTGQGEKPGQSPNKSASGSEGKPGEGSQPGSEGKPGEGGQPASSSSNSKPNGTNSAASREGQPNPNESPGESSSSNPSGQSSPNGQPGANGQGQGDSPPGEGSSENNSQPSTPNSQPTSPLGRTAQSLQQAAQALAEASKQLQSGSPGNGSRGASKPSDKPGSNPSSGDGIGAVGQAGVAPDVEQLKADFQKITNRRWGELPRNVQSEILDAASKRPHGDYARLIKLYFKELAKTQPTAGAPEKPKP